jgi:hypothetical protein
MYCLVRTDLWVQPNANEMQLPMGHPLPLDEFIQSQRRAWPRSWRERLISALLAHGFDLGLTRFLPAPRHIGNLQSGLWRPSSPGLDVGEASALTFRPAGASLDGRSNNKP